MIFGTQWAANIFFGGLYAILAITACAWIISVSMLPSENPSEYVDPTLFLSALLCFEFILVIIGKKIVDLIEKE